MVQTHQVLLAILVTTLGVLCEGIFVGVWGDVCGREAGGENGIPAVLLEESISLASLNILWNEGFHGLAKTLIRFFRTLPGVNSIIGLILDGEVKGAVKLLAKGSEKSSTTPALIPIPVKGVPPDQIIELLHRIHATENTAENGKSFAYTYTTVTDMEQFSKALAMAYNTFSESNNSDIADHERLLHEVWNTFMHTNALNPMMYPSLRRFETEVVSMSAWMLNGDGNVAGSLTSGGTESILMAIKTYRDRAKALRPTITNPNMIAPITVHPAFEKAAHYFGVEIIHIPVDSTCRVIVSEVEKAINRNTILLIGSAPQYCHGVVDPIQELSDLAISKGLPLHVDACFGGFMLPWLEKLGYPIPPFDFRVPGVTSISADIHKYGYTSKGASVILYRNAELRSYQYFAYASWPGGLFGSPSLTGSRPGGAIAAAWAAMVSLGQDGYMKIARDVMNTTEKIIEGVNNIPSLAVITKPDMTCVAIVSKDKKVNIHAVADLMESRGWKIERQQYPDSIHMSVLPQHKRIVDQLVHDLSECAQAVVENSKLNSQGSTGIYGMVAAIPDHAILDDFIVKFFNQIYSVDPVSILEEKK